MSGTVLPNASSHTPAIQSYILVRFYTSLRHSEYSEAFAEPFENTLSSCRKFLRKVGDEKRDDNDLVVVVVVGNEPDGQSEFGTFYFCNSAKLQARETLTLGVLCCSLVA